MPRQSDGTTMKAIASILALAMSALAAGAQVEGPLSAIPGGVTARACRAGREVANASPARPGSPMRRIELADDERIAGFYITDDLPDFWEVGAYVGLAAYPGQVRVGAIFEDDVLGKYVGGQITKMRFAVACPIPVASAYVYECDRGFNVGEAVSVVDLSDVGTGVGWNDVELPAPVTIEEGKYYLLGFEYTQYDDVWLSVSYPLLTDMELDPDIVPTYGFLMYGNLNPRYGYDWYEVTGSGSLCVQAVVRGGDNLEEEDIALGSLSIGEYVQRTSGLDYSFAVRNDGRTIPDSYAIDLSIDGEVVGTLDTPVPLANVAQTVGGNLSLDGVPDGVHVFRVSVAAINGSVPSGNVDDDALESSFTSLVGGADRRMSLIEEFTSTHCGNCPLGRAVIDFMRENNPGQYAVAAIHGRGMGPDPYYLSDGSSDYISTFSGCGGSYPMAAFNRMVVMDDLLEDACGAMAIPIGYRSDYTEIAGTWIDNDVDAFCDAHPAFVGVDIATDYDTESRRLSIKVSGEGASIARDLLLGNRLTVYLTEDGIEGVQEDYCGGAGDSWVDCTHDDVLRMMASQPWGDEINWTAGDAYENDFVVTLDGEWNWENMHVLAFISGPMMVGGASGWTYGDMAGAYVRNANMAALGEGSAGIGAAAMGTGGPVETRRFTMDGRLASSPVKGINIVRMSDGSVRKVMVR